MKIANEINFKIVLSARVTRSQTEFRYIAIDGALVLGETSNLTQLESTT